MTKRTSRNAKTPLRDQGVSLRIDSGSDNEFVVSANRGARRVGYLMAQRRYAGNLWAVADIRVDDSERRKGIGTALYEFAARIADLEGGQLMSDSRVTEMSTGFWDKQRRKGRAVPIDIHSLMPDVEPLVLKPGVRGLKNNPSEPRGFPWPKKAPVYHATTAMRAILDHGFKTRRDLGGAHALGGGTDAAVSFTLDRRTAISIALGLRTIRGITRGEIGLGDLIIQAQEVAPGVLSQVRKNMELEMHAMTPEDVARIDRGLRWFRSSILGGDLEKSTVDPFVERGIVEVVNDHRYGVDGWIPGELLAQLKNEEDRRNHERRWPGTGFDNSELRNWERYGQYRSHIVGAYKALLHFGGWDGESGRKFYNPLFFMTSLGPLAALDDRDIGVLKAHLDADWLCSDPRSAEALGYELPQTVATTTLWQWSEGCQVELDRGRYDRDERAPKTRAEYHSTLLREWEPPDPSDTVALLSSMAEIRVWNTKLIRDIEETENLDDVLNYARDAWDREGFEVDEPYWMPFHRDEIPFSARGLG